MTGFHSRHDFQLKMGQFAFVTGGKKTLGHSLRL
jgi:hypothetical protein